MTRDYTLRDLFWILRRGIAYILGVTLLAFVLTAAFCTVRNSSIRSAYADAPSYSGYVDMQIASAPASDSDLIAEYAYNDVVGVKGILDTYLSILNSPRYFAAAAEALGEPYTADKVAGMVSFKKLTDTTLLRISVKAGSAEECTRICEVYSGIVSDITSDVILSGSAVSLGASAPVLVSAPTINTKLYCIVFTLLAFIAVCAVFIIRNLADPILDEQDDVALLHKATLLGCIERGSRRDTSCAQLASRLRFIHPDGRDVSLLVGCCDGNDAANAAISLATAAAAQGRRVLLADCDFDNPRLGKLLDVDSPIGMAEAAFGGKIVHSTAKAGFDLLTCGTLSRPAAEIAGEIGRGDVVSRLVQEYDCVLLFAGSSQESVGHIAISSAATKAVVIARLHASTHNGLRGLLTDLRITRSDDDISVILI